MTHLVNPCLISCVRNVSRSCILCNDKTKRSRKGGGGGGGKNERKKEEKEGRNVSQLLVFNAQPTGTVISRRKEGRKEKRRKGRNEGSLLLETKNR